METYSGDLVGLLTSGRSDVLLFGWPTLVLNPRSIPLEGKFVEFATEHAYPSPSIGQAANTGMQINIEAAIRIFFIIFPFFLLIIITLFHLTFTKTASTNFRFIHFLKDLTKPNKMLVYRGKGLLEDF